MKTIKVGEWYDWFIHFNKLENVSEGNINWKMLNQYGDYCKKNPMRWRHWRKYTERHERNTGGDWEANVYSVEYLNYGL